MGYNTDFSGEFELDPPLSKEHAVYLLKFNDKRHDDEKESSIDPKPPGAWCQWIPEASNKIVWCPECMKRSSHSYTSPRIEDGRCPKCTYQAPELIYDYIVWDEGEKFYGYVEWLEYLIEHFLKPWGHQLSGAVEWQGEDGQDRGVIHARNNRIQVIHDHFVREEPVWPPQVSINGNELVMED